MLGFSLIYQTLPNCSVMKRTRHIICVPQNQTPLLSECFTQQSESRLLLVLYKVEDTFGRDSGTECPRHLLMLFILSWVSERERDTSLERLAVKIGGRRRWSCELAAQEKRHLQEHWSKLRGYMSSLTTVQNIKNWSHCDREQSCNLYLSFKSHNLSKAEVTSFIEYWSKRNYIRETWLMCSLITDLNKMMRILYIWKLSHVFLYKLAGYYVMLAKLFPGFLCPEMRMKTTQRYLIWERGLV